MSFGRNEGVGSADLSVRVGSLDLANPIVLASGTAGFGIEVMRMLDEGGVSPGAVVLKTVTRRPRCGNPPPRLVETASGLVNSIGLENPGVDALVEDFLPLLERVPFRVVVSIHGESEDDVGYMVDAIRRGGRDVVDAVELNLSCPNVGRRRMEEEGYERVSRLVDVVSSAGFPIWVKMGPQAVLDLDLLSVVDSGGVDAVVVANTYRASVVDWRSGDVIFERGYGGLSGPAVKPLTMYRVLQAREHISASIVACGGVSRPEDVIEYMWAGASAVQVGTAFLVSPFDVLGFPARLESLCREVKVAALRDIIGKAGR